ncbi:ParB/Srx family N-terminal domain-containing protein [Pukyongiella litopenaei]|uniref:ParB-like N-terminal domain-containing protein n=1 Tax=Pukyongiella litopenaei TaxID=2605946 RepID=A0A2S0ML53_9RHOB|nr:ParB/Srx family N-terminal domain-containing protein [Pukyongiella litopenaei]AVO36609.1 hypothetical protein C6Y53_02115 [Pukyongiella litopenaei]
MTLRAIDISEQDPVQRVDPGPAPRMDWLPVVELVVDDTYQRALAKSNWRVIREIAAAFSWSKFTPVIVSGLPDGRWSVIDGQHRVHAAALAGHDRVPAMISPASPAEQAAAFAAINSQRVNITIFHLFKAGLASGEAWAIDGDAAVSAAGCTLMRYPVSAATRKARQVFVLGAVRDHVRAGRRRLITAALAAITSSRAADEVDCYRSNVLAPWLAELADLSAVRRLPDADWLRGFVEDVGLVETCSNVEALRARPGLMRASGYKLARLALREKLKGYPGPRPAARVNAPRCAAPADQAGRTTIKRPAPPMAPTRHGDWTEDRDELIMASGGRYSELARLAETWGVTLQAVQSRWHRVRAT